jgi:anti-sigma B factor antagonist
MFTSPDWDKRGKLKADAQLVRDIGLHLFVRHIDDVVILDLHGKATIGRANDLLDNQLRQLIDEGSSKIVLNLTDVTQMDSSSISSVVRAFKSLKRRGASLRLLGPRGNVRLVLETVHLMDIVPTTEDETQAIDGFH